MASDLSANVGELAKPDVSPQEQRIEPSPP